MESSEQLAAGAVDLSDLAPLVGREGPFLSLYLVTEADVENAAQRAETRWRSARRDLAEQGTPEAVLEQIDAIVPDAHREGECLAVIGDAEELLHVEHGTAIGPYDEARWGALPHLVPIVGWRQSSPPYVVVLIDRTGADLFGFARELPDAIHREVEGEHDEIRKVAPGGWSQRRYQERAEDSWRENAEQVAERVAALVDSIGAELVIVAGDVRATELLRRSLPERLQPLVRVVEGERPWDGKGDPLPEETRDIVERHVRERGDALLARFAEERGQRDHAAEGIAAVADALSRAQVAVLLIADAGGGDLQLWFGPDPTMLSLNERELKELGVDSPQRAPAADVLVRAAIGTGAALRSLEDGQDVREGVGALLRW
jgi:hypothetical protein